MLPGLMVSESPVVASAPRGMAQNAPGRRGKKRNSSTASGTAMSSAPPAKAAHAHASGGSLRSASDGAAAGMAFGPKQRERGEAAMAVLGTAIRRQPHPGKREPVALAVSFGVDHPARELREPHLDVGIRESPEVEHPQLRARRAVLLDEQRRLARVGLPVHLAGRVAIAKRPQSLPLIRLRAAARARPGPRAAFGRHGE